MDIQCASTTRHFKRRDVLTLNSFHRTIDRTAGAPEPEREEIASYLNKLNEAQREAVEYGTRSQLLVIAGAGSGKTNTLAHRVAHLLVQGRRSASHPAADVFAARSHRNDAPRDSHRRERARQRSAHRAGSDVGGHVPQRRRALVARLCGPRRLVAVVHHQRP